jgi:small subunit ribosomal protein S16
MAVRLRLRRIGKKKMPQYQIVAADSRAARNGKFLEIIGRYEPLQHPALIETKEQRLMHWLKCGALPTDTVKSLLQRNGSWLKWSMVRKGADETKVATEMEKWSAQQADKRQRSDARRARRIAAKRKARKAQAGSETPAPAEAEAPAAS